MKKRRKKKPVIYVRKAFHLKICLSYRMWLQRYAYTYSETMLKTAISHTFEQSHCLPLLLILRLNKFENRLLTHWECYIKKECQNIPHTILIIHFMATFYGLYECLAMQTSMAPFSTSLSLLCMDGSDIVQSFVV